MTGFYLYDDATARTFEPFALTRPAGELRAGALLIRERWLATLGVPALGYVAAPHLASFREPDAPPVVVPGSRLEAGSWLVNSRFAPKLAELPASELRSEDGRIVAVRLGADIDSAALAGGAMRLESIARGGEETSPAGGWWIDEVWHLLQHLVDMLLDDLPRLGAGCDGELPSTAIHIGERRVFVEQGAIIEPFACFDTSAGPILVRRGAHVHAFTRLVGPLYVGADSSVMGDRIASSSIGDVCKVHGEVSNTIFLGYANKGHDGFVGHSILGRWVNLGAGTITSNLKNTYGEVSLWTPAGVRATGQQFLGTLFGDHAKTGIGLRLTTGSVLGTGANVFGSVMPPKAVAPFLWGEAGEFTAYRLDKFLEVAERVMSRRHLELTESGRQQLQDAYSARWTASE